jgi:hypothetical protein
VFGFFFNIVAALFQPYTVPDRWARHSGAFGCLFGLVASVVYVIRNILVACLVFFDRFLLGITNGIFKCDYDFVIDAQVKTQVHQTGTIESEKEAFISQGIPQARRRELSYALGYIVLARSIFEKANPRYPDDHKHFMVVRLPDLLAQLDTKEATSMLKLSDYDRDTVKQALQKLADIPSRAHRIATREGKRIDGLKKSMRFQVSDLQDVDIKDERKTSLTYAEKMELLLKTPAPSPWEANLEKTDVSFSRFVQALQPIFTVAPRSTSINSHRASLILENVTSSPQTLAEYIQ